MKFFVVVAIIVILVGCHPLVNPVDPRSYSYNGTPTGPANPSPDPVPDPLLPAPLKWELYAWHAPSAPLPLEINPDGSFIESRAGADFDLVITMSDSFDYGQARGGGLWITLDTGPGPQYGYLHLDDNDIDVSARRILFTLNGVPDQVRARFRLVDKVGTPVGEITFARLTGDVDSSGVVSAPLDQAEVDSVAGFAPSSSNPLTIRADMDRDGVVDSGADGFVVATFTGFTIIAIPVPDFWD